MGKVLAILLIAGIVAVAVLATPGHHSHQAARRVCVTLRYPDGTPFQRTCAASAGAAWQKAMTSP